MWCKRQEGDVWGCSAEVCNEAGNVKFECDFLFFIYLFIFLQMAEFYSMQPAYCTALKLVS